MFCDQCGAQLQVGQKFCGSCGKPAGVVVVPPAGGSRVSRHVHILAVLWFAASALNLIGAAALFLVGNIILGRVGRVVRVEDTWPVHTFLQGLLSAIGVMVLIKALAGFAAGWGLLQRESWARTLTLVLGFVSLINIPLGTALGIYTIWVLLSPGADEEYRRLARAA